jgi:hypothetical protein
MMKLSNTHGSLLYAFNKFKAVCGALNAARIPKWLLPTVSRSVSPVITVLKPFSHPQYTIRIRLGSSFRKPGNKCAAFPAPALLDVAFTMH